MDARKERRGPEEALALAPSVSTVVVAKGKKVVTFKTKDADEAELTKALMGPSGNLRAPAIIVGKKLLIGFHEEPYGDVFG